MKGFLIAYILVINIIAVYVTVHDKNSARKHKWRVPESTLLIIAALSGCFVMYMTMRIIHHKTKKSKFMIGIPVIFVFEILAVLAICYFCGGIPLLS